MALNVVLLMKCIPAFPPESKASKYHKVKIMAFVKGSSMILRVRYLILFLCTFFNFVFSLDVGALLD